MKRLWSPEGLLFMQEQGLDWALAFEKMLGEWLQIGTLLLTLTLAIFVVLVFGVRVLLVVRKSPVPLDPFDMAKPIGFRALMLISAAVLTPPVALDFMPVHGLEPLPMLVVAYVFEIVIAAVLWLLLHLFYSVRQKRKSSRP